MNTTLPESDDGIEDFTAHRRAREQHDYETMVFAEKIASAAAAVPALIAEHGMDSWQVAEHVKTLNSLSAGLRTLNGWEEKLTEREIATRRRIAAQQRTHAARMRSRVGTVSRARVHRNVPARRVVRVAAKKTTAKAAADPDSSSSGDSARALQLGGAQ